jgi:serine/threonine protein phosphatase 1
MDRLIFSIGDSHGCNKAVIKLLKKIEDDRAGKPALIIFLGDYTDRGPYSPGVVQTLLDIQKNPPEGVEYVYLRGNHDVLLMSAFNDPMSGDASTWIYNGGGRTFQQYQESDYKLETHIREFFVRTKLYHKERDIVFVHAGLNPNQSLENQTSDELIYNNYRGNYQDNVFVVHGHTPVWEPDSRTNQLNIDTGCVFRAKYPKDHPLGLTAARIVNRDEITFLYATEEDDDN